MSKARDIADSTETLSVDGGTIKLDGNFPTGANNVALGDTALSSLTTGNQNTALGSDVLVNLTSGNNNVGIGWSALNTATTGSQNIAIGRQALLSNTTGSYNTAVGYQAGYSNQTSGANVFVGENAGYFNTNQHNTFLGAGAGYFVTSGQKNTILGRYNGNQHGLDIRTSSNNIVLSDGDGNPRVKVDANGFMQVGTNAHFTGGTMGGVTSGNSFSPTRLNIASSGSGVSNRSLDLIKTGTATGNLANFYYGGSTIVGSISITASSTSYNTSSDYRLKENVVAMTGATTRLKQLSPSRFNFITGADTTVDGFLAHEVQAVVPEAVTGAKDAVDADGNPDYQGIDQSKLVPLLVATIQELEARITALENA